MPTSSHSPDFFERGEEAISGPVGANHRLEFERPDLRRHAAQAADPVFERHLLLRRSREVRRDERAQGVRGACVESREERRDAMTLWRVGRAAAKAEGSEARRRTHRAAGSADVGRCFMPDLRSGRPEVSNRSGR